MKNRIALFIPTLQPGGVLRLNLDLYMELEKRGFNVDLVVTRSGNNAQALLPDGVNVIDLGTSRVRASVLPFARYLRRESPDAVVSSTDPGNIVAVVARAFAPMRPHLVLSCHQTVTKIHPGNRRLFHRFMPLLMRLTYPRADCVVAVSEATAREVSANSRIPLSDIRIIHNMVRFDEVRRLASPPAGHPWLDESEDKIVLGAGRLTAQKDFDLLIRAFKLVHREARAKLVILGEGGERPALEKLVRSLGLEAHVSLPGFTANPYSYMRRASVFVSSSYAEAFGLVIVEALVCGCPVVAVDCPGGVREILDHGKRGTLVPQGDETALAAAILDRMVGGPPSEDVVASIARLSDPEKCTDAYLSAMGLAPSVQRGDNEVDPNTVV